MIIILYENQSNIILSVADKIKTSYPKSSIQCVGAKEKQTDVLNRFKRPPLFSKGWLIECSPKVSTSLLRKLDVAHNILLIRVTSAKTRDETLKKLRGLNIKLVDNYQPPESEVLEWIQGELKCDYYLARLIYKRTHGNFAQLIDGVELLTLVHPLTEYDVKKYLKPQKNLGLQDVIRFMLGVQRAGITKKDVIKVLYDYRFALNFLVDFFVNQLDIYICVFQYALSGELTLENYQEFYERCDNKVIQNISQYQLKKILECVGEVSLRYVVYVQSRIADINTKDQLGLYKIINLVKMGG